MFKRLLLTVATAFVVGSGAQAAPQGAERLIGVLLNEGVKVEVHDYCKEEGRTGYFSFRTDGSYSGRQVGLCMNNISSESEAWTTLRHEAVHVAQHCRDPRMGDTVLVDGYLEKNLSRYDYQHVVDNYSKSDWLVEWEAFHMEDWSNDVIADIVIEQCQ